jgi:hypothetical protein
MRKHEGKKLILNINEIIERRHSRIILKMGRLNPQERVLASKLKRHGIAIKIIVQMFSCS